MPPRPPRPRGKIWLFVAGGFLILGGALLIMAALARGQVTSKVATYNAYWNAATVNHTYKKLSDENYLAIAKQAELFLRTYYTMVDQDRKPTATYNLDTINQMVDDFVLFCHDHGLKSTMVPPITIKVN